MLAFVLYSEILILQSTIEQNKILDNVRSNFTILWPDRKVKFEHYFHIILLTISFSFSSKKQYGTLEHSFRPALQSMLILTDFEKF